MKVAPCVVYVCNNRRCSDVLSTELREYCFPNSFNASCGPDSVVVMTKARYGRITPGSKCLASEYKVGCWADVLQHLDRRCSGRRHCAISIPDNTMHMLQPCQKDLFAYLEADYACQKGTYNNTFYLFLAIIGVHREHVILSELYGILLVCKHSFQ